ncbi:hypothetical protein B0H21DRAFT_826364 [Amylocystis lapponica]|nr:hypothetical protein B0H21DRAFT_826364 [Amylocystis lapponica]
MKSSKLRPEKRELPIRVASLRDDPPSGVAPPTPVAVYDTPLALEALQKDAFDDKHAKARYFSLMYAEQIITRIVGPMPVEDFIGISLSGPCARFIRWDRAGAIVSRAFSIEDQPHLLCEFLWCFSHASSEERGHDPTIGRASQDGERRFRAVIKARVKYERDLTDEQIRNDPRAVDEHYQQGSVFAMRVAGFGLVGGPCSLRLLVSLPVVSSLEMASRATWGYWAVTEDDEVVFLQDTWRHTAFGLDMKGTVLAKMMYEFFDRGELDYFTEVIHAYWEHFLACSH